VIDLETGEETRLTDIDNHAEGDSFTPDGEWIVFLMKLEGEEQSDIYKIRREGTNLTRLTNTQTVVEGDPEWSHSGEEIVFTYLDAETPRFVLKKMNITGGDIVEVYDGGDGPSNYYFPPGNYDPSWSPDDEWIVYERMMSNQSENWGNGVWHIFNVRRNGTGNTNLSEAGGHTAWAEFLPSFSPDGEFIVFSAYYKAPDPQNSLDDVLVMDSSSGSVMRLTTHPASDKYPVWIY